VLIMSLLLEQLKKRRLTLGLKQKDMMLRIGVSRQQYQQLESKGNPRLNTLELVSKGLKSELMLIPLEKLSLVKGILENDTPKAALLINEPANNSDENRLDNNPWKDLLEDER